jgi:hypothetical protein
MSKFGFTSSVSNISGGLSYVGTWNATTNTPFLASGVGVDGQYYIVNISGTTNLDGINQWSVGDWAIFNGTTWQKIDNSGISYQGSWDALTNTPFLQSSIGNDGHFYIVNVAGTTNLNGITSWNLGDWAIFTSGVWLKIDNTNGISGIGISNELPYWVAPTVLGSLATATYPNLTELSYVKGVTSSLQTQLNNLYVPRLQSVVSSAIVTPTNLNDEVVITAQAVSLTLANPTGTAVQGQSMIIRIKDNGTAQTIGYDTQYRAIGVTLPTTTVINKLVYLGLIYNSTDSNWDCLGVSQEA